ncbi:hypothetical protein Cni_G15722 [Canna indica]|uniref:Subtilisin-like protease fibronectin type-III domain-containing protein n=1 Tax=Canna indica TaxID=4628 RepID=A0AAQ3KK03_9LILI|nr:hypothetical protein Cni_G15722 [Canna indica]
MALQDGVDVISISIGLPAPKEFSIENNPIAIGAMRAIKKGVSVVCAAGNSGPAPETVRNAFPWVLTVAAGSMDRSFLATVKLGDGQEFEAELKINSNDVSIQVDPKVLEFHHQNQKLSFTVSVTVNNGGHGAEGYLQWVSKKYNVRSPIVVV